MNHCAARIFGAHEPPSAPQLLLACSGADRDPENAMKWLGKSQGHLMLLQGGGDVARATLTPLMVADVGCNCMSMAQLPSTAGGGTTTTATLLLTDMSDPHGAEVDDVGSVHLYTASATKGAQGEYEGSIAPAQPGMSMGSCGPVVATTGGKSPCAVAVCPQPIQGAGAGRLPVFLAAVACYEGAGGSSGDGVVALLELTHDDTAEHGSGWTVGRAGEGAALGAPASVALHGAASAVGGGATPGKGRQDAAHPHGVEWWAAAVDAADMAPLLLFVADLGANKVVAYTVEGASAGTAPASAPAPTLRVVSVCTLHAGAGPRHMRLVAGSNAHEATLFTVNELDNTLVAIAVSRRGSVVTMHVVQTVSTLPPDFDLSRSPPFDFYTAASHACAIVLHEHSEHARDAMLFVSNRGDDSVATFRVRKSATGHATAELVCHTSCAPGRLPWDLSIDRTGTVGVISSQLDAELKPEGGGLALWDLSCDEPLVHHRTAQPVATVCNVLAVRFLHGGVH